MFDYFLRFSAFLADLTGAECEWLQEQLAIVYIVDGAEYPEGELPAGKTEADATWIGCRAYLGWDAYEPDPSDEVGFLYSFADKPDKAGRWFLHLYATQSGNVGNVAYVVQKFLKRFRPADSWCLTYCIGSDRAGVGEFGGGAVFVTATDVESFTAEEWATGRAQVFENRTPTPPTPTNPTRPRPRVVVNVSGGMIQDVFCTDPEAVDILIADWDTQGSEPGELVEVPGHGTACVVGWFAEPLEAMEGTDVGAALDLYDRKKRLCD